MTDNSSKGTNFMNSIMATPWRFLCTLFGSIAVLSVSLLILLLIFRYLGIYIEVGGVKIQNASGEKVSRLPEFVTIHASLPWQSTGVRVSKGNSLKIRATGQVGMAFHHLYNFAERLYETKENWSHKPYSVFWNGPDGFGSVPPTDPGPTGERIECLLNKSSKYGSLIGMISSYTNYDILDHGRSNVNSIFLVGSNYQGKVSSDGILHLAVNDVYLDKSECDKSTFNEIRQMPESRSRRYPEARYNLVFYDDNIGLFSVRISVNE